MAFLGNCFNNGQTFDANEVAPADFSALPSGDYAVLISNSEFKLSKSGDQYLSLTIQILEGPHTGRFLWHSLNLMHSTSEKAREIAQRELSAICHATGKLVIKDSSELHDTPMLIKVVYVPPKDDGNGGQWPEKNQIKSWKPYGAATPTPAPAAQAVARSAPRATPAAPAAAKTPPKAPPAAAAQTASPAPDASKKPWMNPRPAAPAADKVPAEDIPF